MKFEDFIEMKIIRDSFSVSYNDLIDIIRNNSLNFYYADNAKYRYIIARLSKDIIYISGMNLVDNPETGSDQIDFDTNWKHLAGTGDYKRYSWKKTIAAGTTDVLNIKIQKNSVDVDSFIYKGKLTTNENSIWGDKITIKAVDIDDILGYGPGFVIDEIIYEYCSGGKELFEFNPPDNDTFTGKKRIPAGIYLQIEYTSNGANDVSIICSGDFRIF